MWSNSREEVNMTYLPGTASLINDLDSEYLCVFRKDGL